MINIQRNKLIIEYVGSTSFLAGTEMHCSFTWELRSAGSADTIMNNTVRMLASKYNVIRLIIKKEAVALIFLLFTA